MPDPETLKRAVLAESVYNFVSQRGDQSVSAIAAGLLAAWNPGPIELTAETVAAAAKRLADLQLVEVEANDGAEALASAELVADASSSAWVSIPQRGPRGRGQAIYVDREKAKICLGVPR